MGNRDRNRQLRNSRRLRSAETLYKSFNEKLVFLVRPVELTGLSSQLDGLGDSYESTRDACNLDLISPSVAACPDPRRKCSCDNVTFHGRNGLVEELVDTRCGSVSRAMAPVFLVSSVRLRRDAIGRSSSRRHAITKEAWSVGTTHSVQDSFCCNGNRRSK